MSVLTLEMPTIVASAGMMTSSAHLVQGRDSILLLRSLLIELSTRCGQAGAMDQLEYYLSRPGFVGKKPTLILVSPGSVNRLPIGADEVTGAALVYEQQVRGVGCKVFSADYHGGERTVIAPLASRPRVAFLVAAALMKRRALAVRLTYEDGTVPTDAGGVERPGKGILRWCAEERPMTGYLPIEDTVDDTLANLGKHTRRNLRQYRRRAEANLGYVQIDQPEISREEFLALNRMSAYPVSEQLAGWRYDATRLFAKGCLFLGLRAANGDWLSVIGGRTHEGSTVIEWQMNRTDMPSYSLSTLMRSHLIEHEVERRTKRIYFEAGTSHSIRNSMVPDKFVDLTVLRYRVPASLARRFLPKDGEAPNFLLRTLADETQTWHSW